MLWTYWGSGVGQQQGCSAINDSFATDDIIKLYDNVATQQRCLRQRKVCIVCYTQAKQVFIFVYTPVHNHQSSVDTECAVIWLLFWFWIAWTSKSWINSVSQNLRLRAHWEMVLGFQTSQAHVLHINITFTSSSSWLSVCMWDLDSD